MIILSFETSCDETSVAVTQDGKTVLSNIVFSQIKYHQIFGGVVPEIASRKHIQFMTLVLEQALKEAQVQPQDIDLVAVTHGPGLIGSLLIGINAANVFAYVHQKPLLGINHLLGHVYAAQIEHEIKPPALVLLISGGHTELLYLKEHGQIEVLGTTLDDAVGEVYDKIAKVLQLPYPGGPLIDQLAQQGQDTYCFVRPYLKNNNLNFSFSGLKSHLVNLILNRNIDTLNVSNICASFQASVIDVLFEKTKRALTKYPVKQLIVTGGVASNMGLRHKFSSCFTHLEVIFPSVAYCTDQAAMIGIAAYYQNKITKATYKYDLTALPNLTF
ncbi:tRNA (adenosine(37)-N6)-threonylcarbamoyltransferase complex transferase subunit TsaD [Candidatus Phytoplasma meliae]|uniref:tRNA N6-adenosine threonylcarbamoyltransferase n=1 Tax=Candidatus Phytoplasma meliae TaxID=1848402 RepID=A0ABS5CZ67_9MOLU|nr:tRNA (adenosine(37)-N6)-threonylcarbamoyltransferase complex transferase subunit TsaD [Candidatus Phytoplasma meliae]MBP5836170.1 tRNA (adenosine(37)-N6)-threonylcarbamoyltransferase complex transferase subunit TsaD [Candidatus Phytoplasma meliae]MBP5836273.1 tRNA (adenosine(37)-N6)-threonylcarbamoyltransferase complex transferase subunit TsaD [Candidatus Phytoplasma meliae]